MAQKTNIISSLIFSVIVLKLGGLLWFRRISVLSTHTYLGDDYPRAWSIRWPESDVLVPIHDTVRYQLDTDDGAAEWAASAPGNGLIYLGDQCRPFTVSMFHQIRCLDTLRKTFVRAQSDNVNTTHPPDTPDWPLTRHCLNYMRQMVLCRAHQYLDPILGYPIPNAHPDVERCRDWSELYREALDSQRRCST
ncbi:hypothetical protein B0H10DRAFT_1986468 [Mycena sp. CBHHK59/15]|nr:hypothetical protein B0H10DRAFT_2032669 [Mycena sp. CBHHK59/15]KAJ6629289.1 hypothetical protein B0H10DRAFT_1986468 [Mycena sp. CBHHK59/15]